MALDVKLLYLFNDFAGKSQIFDTLIIFLAAYSQYFIVTAFLLLLYFSVYSKREKLRIFWITTISIIIARLGITEIIRFFYHRPRPFLTLQVNKLLSDSQWFYSDTEWSFPSGHSAFFFAMATAIYLYNKKWGTWFFIAAILMNISRVVAGVHYPSDILGGAIVGVAVGYLVVYFAEKWKLKEIGKLL
ncbi:phosphatase PAP2 family protein [Patescibacteria group bacterium]|nr:MAG: phosphatase PAP2 family protein [Patescibacteria group bacterium]